MELTSLDRELLDAMQSKFPLVKRPYQALGEMLGTDEETVIERVRLMKQSDLIRQTSAIFDSKRLGYKSILMAFKIADDKIEAAAEIVNGHPGVSHNYQRQDAWSLWCTLTVPPGSNLETHAAALSKMIDAEDYMLLPSIRLFKIGVNFKMGKSSDTAAKKIAAPLPSSEAEKTARAFSDEERRAILALQQDLPAEARAFDSLAAEAGITVQDLLYHAKRFIAEKIMRRFAAILRHRKAGYAHNIMSVWAVPNEIAAEVGEKMAAFREVSHCYQRPTPGDWTYSHYAMIHAQSKEDALGVVESIANKTGMADYRMLHTVREFKKIRVQYFTQEIIDWEKAHC